MANRMTPPAEGQEKDVLLVLDKQQGKVSAVKGIDKEGNLQTVLPTTGHGGEFMQVDKNSDVFSNFISNFFRKFQDTSGLELFSVKASQAEQDAKAIENMFTGCCVAPHPIIAESVSNVCEADSSMAVCCGSDGVRVAAS